MLPHPLSFNISMSPISQTGASVIICRFVNALISFQIFIESLLFLVVRDVTEHSGKVAEIRTIDMPLYMLVNTHLIALDSGYIPVT